MVWVGTLQTSTISTPPPQTLKIRWNKKEIGICSEYKNIQRGITLISLTLGTYNLTDDKMKCQKGKEKGAKHFSVETPQMVTRVWVAKSARTHPIPNLILNPLPLPFRWEHLLSCAESMGTLKILGLCCPGLAPGAAPTP